MTMGEFAGMACTLRPPKISRAFYAGPLIVNFFHKPTLSGVARARVIKTWALGADSQ